MTSAIAICDYCWMESGRKLSALDDESLAVIAIEAKVHVLAQAGIDLPPTRPADRYTRVLLCLKHWDMSVWGYMLASSQTQEDIEILRNARNSNAGDSDSD